jgi:hypothetical protein
MIGGYNKTPHVQAMPTMVVDLRSDHQSTKITSTTRISKYERERRQRRTATTPISKDHTNSETDPKDLGY